MCLTTWSGWTSTPSTTSGLTWETSGQRTTPSVARRVQTPAATVTARVQSLQAAPSVAPADTVDRCTSTGSVIDAQLTPVQGPAQVQHQPRRLSQWHHPEAPLARTDPVPGHLAHQRLDHLLGRHLVAQSTPRAHARPAASVVERTGTGTARRARSLPVSTRRHGLLVVTQCVASQSSSTPRTAKWV